MKYAYYPGCVSQNSGKELDVATRKVCRKLDIALVDFPSFSCCGAGFVDEADMEFNYVLNARNLALAEGQSLDMLTICSTCQGMLSRSNHELTSGQKLMAKTSEVLSKIGMQYRGNVKVKHLLWILVSDYGLDKLKQKIVKPLTGLRVAAFYGCHMVRPKEIVQYEDPEDPKSLELLIQTLGAEPVMYRGRTSCCGFPVLLHKESDANMMAGMNLLDAKHHGADCMVTPCPLCHISLDSFQGEAEKQTACEIGLPVLHLPQLVGLALGFNPPELGIYRHLVDARAVLEKVGYGVPSSSIIRVPW